MSEPRTRKRIFFDALELAEEERAPFVELSCGDDDELRHDVGQLLAAHGHAGSFLETPTETEVTVTRSLSVGPGTVIGRYHIRELIGEGGFGMVYRAEQREPLRREVALKIIKLGMDTHEVIARFEAERQALALMDHPHVSRVIDAGATEEGRPYFVMEYTPGEAITDYCDRCRLTNRQRLELFIQTCEAVQHAHQKGIIHRDLKPSNVLVSETAGHPEVKVIDFGVAKAISQPLTGRTIFTERGQLIGTPEYMSPEQAELGGHDIDTRTDIYSLGVILYQLLSGTLPFDGKALRRMPLPEIQHIICEQDPPKPSTRLSELGETTTEIARKHRSEPRTLLRELRGDLDWITMKAMEKDRSRRYETPVALAADIRRHLDHEPVVAGPPSTTYRMGKFVRRHRTGVAAAALVVTVLLLGMAGTSWGLVEAIDAREQTKKEADKYQQIARFTGQMLSAVNPEFAGDLDKTLMRMILDDAATRIELTPSDEPEVDAAIRITIGSTYHAIGDYDAAEIYLVDALEIRRDALGDEHPDTLESVYSMGVLRKDQGKLDDAEAYLLEALEGRRRVLGENHSDTLIAAKTLGGLFVTQGNLDEAEPLLLETVERSRRVLGDEHPTTLTVISEMGLLLDTQGKMEEAEQLAREVYEARRRILGDTHLRTLGSLNNLGRVLEQQGKLTESESYYRETLESYRDAKGAEHPETLMIMNNLGLVLWEQGRYAESEEYLREALETGRRLMGTEHPQTLTKINNLALVLQAQGKMEEAEPLYREALDVGRIVLGEEHPETLKSLENFGFLLFGQGRLAEAEPYCREALEIRRRVLGNDHKDTQNSVMGLGLVLLKQGKLDEAEPYLEEALTMSVAILGAQHMRTHICHNNLAELFKERGEPERAEPHFRQALTGLRVELGDKHPYTLAIAVNLGLLLQNSGELDEAETLLREAVDGTRKALGDEHADTLKAISDLGSVLLSQENLDEAEQYLREASDGQRRVLGDEHNATLITMYNLAIVLNKQERYDEAETILRIYVDSGPAVYGESDWRVELARSCLGEVIAGQKRFEEAEPLLLDAYDGLDAGSPDDRHARDLAAAARRLVRLYEAWDKPDEAAKWRPTN